MRKEFIEELHQIDEKIEIELSLPKDWWFATYSYNYYARDDSLRAKIIPLKIDNTKTPSKESIKEELPTPSEWDFSKGDYHMQESCSSKQQYTYNNRLKIRFLRYSIYPALAIALLFTLLVLSIIVGI